MSATALRWAADILDSIPGLPPVYVSATDRNISIQIIQARTDDDARAVAVDMLAAVLGLTPRVEPGPTGRSCDETYEAEGTWGEYNVHVYAPHCHVIREQVRA